MELGGSVHWTQYASILIYVPGNANCTGSVLLIWFVC